MNLEASPQPESISEIGAPEQLIAAREARGWSISDVAAKLGMMPRQIDAIEQGRWDALPGPAFVRGAIRAYGKALQTDVAPLLAALGSQANVPELRPSSSLDSPLPRHGALGFDNGGSGSRIVWILLGVLGVVAIAMYFGRGADFGQVLDPDGGAQPSRAVDVVPLTPGPSSGSRESDATSGAASAGPGASAGGASAAGASSGAAGAAPGASQAASPATPSSAVPSATPSAGASTGTDTGTAGGGPSGTGAAGTATNTSAAATPSIPAAAGAAAPAGVQASSGAAPASSDSGATSASGAGAAGSPQVSVAGSRPQADSAEPAASQAPSPAESLVLRFERESWVEVRDATGRVLLLGTQPANSVREVSGQKPYSMTIGNASFVRVEHGGRSVDLGAVTQKGVARVRVE